MRLHTLSLSAFGPFADTVTVDLDDLGREGLFLLWGPTGAGKTTLLDAVVFALYQTVPGARGQEKRWRSDHADAATRTEVTLELSLAGERLRVVRRPEQTRPKKRGSGETTEQAQLRVLRRRGDEWETVSTRLDEGGDYLRRRLGLDPHQFCQVVMLQQGDFARFLRAEPEQRAELLATLFDVGRFVRAEEWLVQQRRTAEEALRGERLRASTLLARVAQIADAEVPEALAPELVGADPTAEVTAWVAGLRSAAAGALAGAEAAADDAAARSARLDAELDAARALAERHTRRDRARAELDRLSAAEAQLAPLRARRDSGRRAEALRDVLDAARRAADDAAAAAAALAEHQAAWAGVGLAAQPDGVLARRLRDDAAAVRSLLPDAERATAEARELARLDRELADLQRRCAAGARTAGELPERLAALQEELDRASAAEVRLPAARAAAEALAAAREAAAGAEERAATLPAVRTAADTARTAWMDARESLLDLRARRLDGMAAELAAGLADGADCPVCGSREHPRPAVGSGPQVSADDEERARQAADDAEQAAAAARSALEELERELAVLRERAGPLPAASLGEQLTAARRALDLTAAEGARAGKLRERLAATTAQRDAVLAALTADRELLQARTAERAARGAAHAELVGRLDAARGEDPDLPARVRRLERAAERCEAVLAAHADELRARAAVDTARLAAAERGRAAGFRDAAAAAGALLPPGELATLERRIEEHEHARAAVLGVLAQPELVDLPARPDVEAIHRRCAELTATREDAVAVREQARRRAAALEGLAGEVVAAEIALHERRSRAEQVSALADLVTGRGANTLRMRLQSFVLAARLEQVAEVASRRLSDMSGGRYTFEHTDAQGRHGARGGLGLVVLDEYTGTRRPTKTLSGGESFMASLALALGLADVVTAESGGVQIDTLFVDEGFGTLDAQALDAVMTVLDELRRGGRTVGVISHVEEMRTRIPTRLEVVAGRRGSRLAG